MRQLREFGGHFHPPLVCDVERDMVGEDERISREWPVIVAKSRIDFCDEVEQCSARRLAELMLQVMDRRACS